MTNSQAKGYKALDQFRYDDQCPPSEVFGRDAPLVVEIGFGNGEALAGYAEENPDWNCIGVEVYRPGIGALVRRCQEFQLKNVRIAEVEAHTFVENLPQSSVQRMFVFFPDPWPKKRHHKRRLINESFLHVVTQKLMPGATLQIATDWENYAEAIEQSLTNNRELEPCLRDDCFTRPKTRFEQRGEDLGHQVWDFCYACLETR